MSLLRSCHTEPAHAMQTLLLIKTTELLSYGTSLQKAALFSHGAAGSFMLSVVLRLKTQGDQAFGINLLEGIRLLYYCINHLFKFSTYG